MAKKRKRSSKPERKSEYNHRPPFPWDYAQLRQMRSIQCTDDEIATIFGCTTKTIERAKRRDPKFREAYEKGSAEGKQTLRRAQVAAAYKGNATMLVWLGKQMLGQKDVVRNEITGGDGEPIKFANADEETAARIAALLDAARARRADAPDRDAGNVGAATRPANTGAGKQS